MPNQRRLASWLTLLIIVVIFLVGAVGAAIPAKIVDLIASKNLDTVAANTATSTSVAATFQAMAGDISARLRISGIVLVLVAVALLVARRFVLQYLREMARTLPGFASTLSGQFTNWITTEDKEHLVAGILILLMAIVLRLAFISQPMRYDEAITYNNFASVPLYIGLSNYFAPNNHLFHTFLVHLTTRFGSAEWLVRLPAFLAGILIVPATYILSLRFFNKNVALIAAGIVACSSILIEYSTNARGYTLLTLLFVLALLTSASLIRSHNPVTWSVFVFLLILGFFTIPTMLYGFAIIVCWLAVAIFTCLKGQERIGQWQRLIAACVFVGLGSSLLYLPAYTVWGLQAIIGNSYVTALPMSEFLANFPSIVPTLWSDWTRDIPLILSVFLGICFLIGVFASKHLGKVPAYLIAPLTIVIYSAMLFLQRVIPFTRVWLFLVPLWAILTAIGITVILDLFARQRMGQALAEGCALILCLGIGLNVIAAQSVYYSDATGTLRDGDQIVGFLADYLQKTDRIYATVPSDAPLLYYLKRHQLPISIIAKTADTLSTADRIIIVVNKTSMPLEEMMNRLNNLGVSTTAYTSPEFVRSFPFADLYVIRKWSAFIDTVSLKNTERF